METMDTVKVNQRREGERKRPRPRNETDTRRSGKSSQVVNYHHRNAHICIAFAGPATLRSVSGIGLRRSPEPVVLVLSPLSLALLSLTRLDRLSRLLTPRSESIDRFGECEPFTAFFRRRCAAYAFAVCWEE